MGSKAEFVAFKWETLFKKGWKYNSNTSHLLNLVDLMNRAFSNFSGNIYTNNFKVPNGRTST